MNRKRLISIPKAFKMLLELGDGKEHYTKELEYLADASAGYVKESLFVLEKIGIVDVRVDGKKSYVKISDGFTDFGALKEVCEKIEEHNKENGQ